MRKLAVFVAAAVGTASLAVFAGPASAKVVADKDAACEILTNTGIEPGQIADNPDDPGAVGRSNARKLSKAFKKAAKEVSGKNRKNFKALAAFYKTIADGDTPSTAEAQKYAKAVAGWISFMIGCIDIDIPDIPDIDIPGA